MDPLAMLPADIAGQTTFALVVSQAMVNAIRKALGDYSYPRWFSPLLAYFLAILVAFLIMLFNGGSITVQRDWTGALIAGLVAGSGAIAGTELTRSAANRRPPVHGQAVRAEMVES